MSGFVHLRARFSAARVFLNDTPTDVQHLLWLPRLQTYGNSAFYVNTAREISHFRFQINPGM